MGTDPFEPGHVNERQWMAAIQSDMGTAVKWYTQPPSREKPEQRHIRIARLYASVPGYWVDRLGVRIRIDSCLICRVVRASPFRYPRRSSRPAAVSWGRM